MFKLLVLMALLLAHVSATAAATEDTKAMSSISEDVVDLPPILMDVLTKTDMQSPETRLRSVVAATDNTEGDRVRPYPDFAVFPANFKRISSFPKPSSSFLSWAGKRSMASATQDKRFQAWAGKRSGTKADKPFRSWSGKRSGDVDYEA